MTRETNIIQVTGRRKSTILNIIESALVSHGFKIEKRNNAHHFIHASRDNIYPATKEKEFGSRFKKEVNDVA
jgi:hypothetical protein